jgi:RsiW-degrading membrane proteinase PrsW (M82 family)
MPISFLCYCGKRLKAKDEWAGKRVKCPGCGTPLVIPEADDDDGRAYQVAPPPPRPPRQLEEEEERVQAAAREPARLQAAAAERYKDILAEKPSRSPGDFAYWGLLIALIPLCFSLLGKEDSVEERLAKSLENAPRDVQGRIVQIMLKEKEGEANDDDLINALPGRRIEGSHLSRGSFLHYLYALMAAAAFFTLGLFLVPSEDGKPLQLLLLGLFTGTVGIVLLLVAQFLAALTQGHVLISGNPVILIIYYVAYAIGFSYRAAFDPDMGFAASFFGFTFGVGLCEEVCKALPLIFYYRTTERPNWRTACAWGFASGVGFGVAEAILYAHRYNGINTAGIYVVRFVSCVALHAIWSTSSALFIHRYRSLLEGHLAWHDYIPRVLVLVAVPMVLHGLYDTALKSQLNSVALVAALASFGWFAWCIERAWANADEVPAKPRPRYA